MVSPVRLQKDFNGRAAIDLQTVKKADKETMVKELEKSASTTQQSDEASSKSRQRRSILHTLAVEPYLR